MNRNLPLMLGVLLTTSGCIATTVVGVAGDVVEGGVNATVTTGKVAARTAGAIIPGGDDEAKSDDAKAE